MLVFFLFETIDFDILQLDKISKSLSKMKDRTLEVEFSGIEVVNITYPSQLGVHLKIRPLNQDKLFNLLGRGLT